MIKGPCASSSVDETDTPLVLGKEKTGISSPTLSRGANGLGGLPVSLAVAIEVSFGLLYYPPPRHAPVARQFAFCHRVPRQLMLLGHRQHHSEAALTAGGEWIRNLGSGSEKPKVSRGWRGQSRRSA